MRTDLGSVNRNGEAETAVSYRLDGGADGEGKGKPRTHQDCNHRKVKKV